MCGVNLATVSITANVFIAKHCVDLKLPKWLSVSILCRS